VLFEHFEITGVGPTRNWGGPGYMSLPFTNCSFSHVVEKVADGPPTLPAVHFSGPDTHPTPGQWIIEPGH
jgi:hypothetical protein